MKPLCSICGRRTVPFAFLGAEPIGPNCARKLGLTKKAAAAKAGRVRFAAPRSAKLEDQQTLDLFPETIPTKE